MPTQDDKIGALWAKSSRGGVEFYKGTIEIDGTKHEVVVFRNGFKETDRHPHFIVYRSQPGPVQDPTGQFE